MPIPSQQIKRTATRESDALRTHVKRRLLVSLTHSEFSILLTPIEVHHGTTADSVGRDAATRSTGHVLFLSVRLTATPAACAGCCSMFAPTPMALGLNESWIRRRNPAATLPSDRPRNSTGLESQILAARRHRARTARCIRDWDE